ncbi:MAG: NAD-dependent epimerase/dehydratase family protein [Candidatus Eisenbacteria bacterium]|uniref:NAD-dependent epimerase/dehydratase family protein n=1 Tax=Eiseniibacteriota bacterium TaxID=2212470 RepID=A0A7Y2E5I8_UNCEI|nr:NAD-dependent epimerase/dehydratase family protein [Candidatus Eisenbacteria bacterium]
MKIFLTGGTGYLGGAIARAARSRGHDVLALVRDENRAAPLLGCGSQLCKGSLEELGDWETSLKGCDALIHTAALVQSWGHPPSTFDELNVKLPLALLERAKTAGITRRLVTSTLFTMKPSENGEPLKEDALLQGPKEIREANDYVRSKGLLAARIQEQQRAGESVNMVFPTVLMGPGALTAGNHTANILSDVGKKKFPGLVGDGNQKWNLVGVDDAARGHLDVLERGKSGDNYILGGENWTQRKLVEEAARRFDVKAPTRALGTLLPNIVAVLSESLSRLTGKAPMLTRGEVRLYNQHWSFDSTKAIRDLGYEPTAMDTVLDETVRWIRERVWR